MNIQSVSSNSNNTYLPLTEDRAIELLNKQKMQLQDQIQKVNEGKLDSKAKQERIKQLQDQIQQIDTEIQQIQSEKLRKSQEKNGTRQTTDDQSAGLTGANSANVAGMADLVGASLTYSKAKIMNNVKDEFTGRARILKKEIELDESRSVSAGSASSKRNELEKIESRMKDLDDKVDVTYKKVQEQVKSASDKLSGHKADENNNGIEDKKEAKGSAGIIDVKV